MTRQRLPDRRQSITLSETWKGQVFTITVGFDDDGKPREVFAAEAKGDLLHIIADACVSISLNLQCGMSPEEVAHSMGFVPDWVIRDGQMVEADVPASPIGAILAGIAQAAAWRATGCEVAA